MKIIDSRCIRAAVLGPLLFASSGCSLIFVHPRSSTSYVSGPRRACTSSKLAPVLDTLFAGAQVVRTAYALSASDSVYENPAQPLSRGADVGLGVGFATLFVGSAIYGYVNTSACSKRRQDPSGPDDVDLSPEKWMTSPTPPKAAAPGEQLVQPAASPSPPGSVEPPAPPVAPADTDVPGDAPSDPTPLPAPGDSGS